MTLRHELIYQARYAVRLTQRTARLYRRIQTAGTFLAIIGGSGTISLLSSKVPAEIGIAGAFLMTIAGAVLVSVRPADKAAQNETDAKKYLALMSRSNRLNDDELAAALEEARLSDCQEIEPLRDVAFNDVVAEYGREDAKVKLTLHQTMLAALA